MTCEWVWVCMCVCLYKALLRWTGACLISGSNQSRNMDKLLLPNPALSLDVSIVFPRDWSGNDQTSDHSSSQCHLAFEFSVLHTFWTLMVKLSKLWAVCWSLVFRELLSLFSKKKGGQVKIFIPLKKITFHKTLMIFGYVRGLKHS